MDKAWSQFYENHGRFYLLPHPKLNKFINLARQRNYKKVLDLGCGSGRHVIKLAQEGFSVSGIDISPSAAQLCEEWLHQKGLEADIIVGDFDDKTKDFPEYTFQAVIAINTLEYGEEGELEKNLEDISRLLVEKGLLFLVYRSKETSLKHPELPTQLYEFEEFKKIISKYFQLIESSQDENKNFVVIAEKGKHKIVEEKKLGYIKLYEFINKIWQKVV